MGIDAQLPVGLCDTLPYRRLPWLYYTNTDYTYNVLVGR